MSAWRVCAVVAVVAATAAAVAVARPTVGDNQTVCGAEAIVCPDSFSDTKEGCCTLGHGATCCYTPLGPANGLKRNYCCPAGSQCSLTGCTPIRPIYSCGPGQGENCSESFVCAPGPLPWVPEAGKPSVVVIGDSVSIGWTPVLGTLVQNGSFQAVVTHSPASGDGGARSTSDMLACYKYRVATSTLEPLPLTKSDFLVFNFGLHDYNLGPAGVAQYGEQLANITRRLQSSVTAKMLFVGTTPAHNTASPVDDSTVQLLNAKAADVMKAAGIPFLDMYTPLINECGPVPWADEGPNACTLCAPDCKALSVHYTKAGYNVIASHVLAAIKALETTAHLP
mmetsp:Transcript_20842/g.54173  ORF Transcript_20842/g.54173 Transcript_20842/m.54173 type:complete len:338 (+) Transcript_20842:22-1035(+)